MAAAWSASPSTRAPPRPSLTACFCCGDAPRGGIQRRPKRQPPVHSLPAPRPLANTCLCEALGRQARGCTDFCAVLLKNNTAGLATVDRASKRQQRSRTSAGAAGRGVSIRCRSCSTGRLILIGEVQQAARRRKRATSCRLAAVLRLAQLPSTGTGFVKGC